MRLAVIFLFLGLLSCGSDELLTPPEDENQILTYGDLVVRVVRCKDVICLEIEPVSSVQIEIYKSEEDRAEGDEQIGQQFTIMDGTATFRNTLASRVFIKVMYEDEIYLDAQTTPIATISYVEIVVGE